MGHVQHVGIDDGNFALFERMLHGIQVHAAAAIGGIQNFNVDVPVG